MDEISEVEEDQDIMNDFKLQVDMLWMQKPLLMMHARNKAQNN